MDLKFNSILINQEIAMVLLWKRHFHPRCPLFQRAGWTIPLSFSHFPASLLAYTVFLSAKSSVRITHFFVQNVGNLCQILGILHSSLENF